MDNYQAIIDKIKLGRLPLSYMLINNLLLIDCKGWDINEIDDMILSTNGTRDGFIIKIEVDSEDI